MKNFTKFNPENKELLTYAECLEPAMNITEQADADQYFKAYFDYQRKFCLTDERALYCIKTNLGYYVGYYSYETRERIERLFNCAHPYFGKIAVNGPPTNETALNIGMAIGSKR